LKLRKKIRVLHDASFSPMDSAAIPSLPPQWSRWQQATSHLPLMVATASTALPPRGSRSNSQGASRRCGGAQFAVVMRSTASCPPGRSLRAAGKLYTNELQMPTSLHFSQATKRCCAESTCCKCTFWMFQMFHRYVAIISYGCCKSRLRCCICCNSCTCMLQAFVPVFSDVCCKCVYLDVAYVLHRCCKCFM
jgi:hypothetical protein